MNLNVISNDLPKAFAQKHTPLQTISGFMKDKLYLLPYSHLLTCCHKSVIFLTLDNTAHSKSMEIWCESCLLDWKTLKTASAQKTIKGATTQNLRDFKYVIFIKDFMENNPWFYDFMVYNLAILDNLTKNVLRKRCEFIDITDMHF